jgi:hypothetical protein
MLHGAQRLADSHQRERQFDVFTALQPTVKILRQAFAFARTRDNLGHVNHGVSRHADAAQCQWTAFAGVGKI